LAFLVAYTQVCDLFTCICLYLSGHYILLTFLNTRCIIIVDTTAQWATSCGGLGYQHQMSSIVIRTLFQNVVCAMSF